MQQEYENRTTEEKILTQLKNIDESIVSLHSALMEKNNSDEILEQLQYIKTQVKTVSMWAGTFAFVWFVLKLQQLF